MFDRRHFLIGAGALLTTSFVRRASAFSRKTDEPLILPAVRKPEETLYVYWQADNEVADRRVSLGPDQPFPPPPPTWLEHLASLGVPLGTEDDIERVCNERDVPREDLDARLNGFGWQDRWDNFTGPQASAFHLLKSIDLGPADSPLRREGEIIFEEFGGGPGNGYTWVELGDDLTASLLRERLIELACRSTSLSACGSELSKEMRDPCSSCPSAPERI
jgi:hypothetical protein